jgi:Cysteine-rich secretory protein family
MQARLLIALLLLTSITARTQQIPNDQQQKLLDLTNKARTDQGLQPLHWDPSLAAAAQAHAQKMFDQHSLSHQLPGEPDLQTRAAQAGAHFREIAENVAMGNGAEGAQKEWMNSAPHRANILDPKLTDIGIGVVEHAGYWYAVVDFDSAVQGMDPSQIEQKVAAMLRQHNIDPSRPPDAARKDCAVDEGDASGTHPLFVMRWESSSLDRLPDPLEQRIATGRYKTASVGACGNQQAGNQGFTTYHIAVLLY